MSEIDAYNEALGSGQYQKPGGLLGKYDNVRRFWEDEELGLYLRPYLEGLLERSKTCGRGLRVLDLGCGSGDGFEFLTGISSSRSLISEHNTKMITPDRLEFYRGVDVNEGLLAQARVIYGRQQNMEFVLSDYNNTALYDRPYDLYLANYGTLSHNRDEQTMALLGRVAASSEAGAIVITDWLGRFSYEWQTLWTHDFRHHQWLDYVISYLRADSQTTPEKLSSFPLRIMGRREALHIYRQARRRSGGHITLRCLADRSSLVGRHIDTARYNPHCQPLRRLLNSLFEPNMTTDLGELMVRYVPADGFTGVNAYYQRLAAWWNYLVAGTQALLEKQPLPPAPARRPSVVVKALQSIRAVVRAAAMSNGHPRASLVEPQLGYCLRELEMELQQGLGCGHGLVAVFEITK